MIEKLKAYRAELEEIKAKELAKDINIEVEKQVAEYRAKLQAEAIAEQENIVAKIDSDIDCVDWLMKRESDIRETCTEEAPVEPVAPVITPVTIVRR